MPNQQSIQINGVDIEWDTERGSFSFFGAPSALFWINPSLLTMLQPLAKEIGHDLFRLEVASSASIGTEEDYHAMVTVLGDTFEEGFIKWGEAVSGAGWGTFEILEYDLASKHAIVRVRNTWELLMQESLSNRWGCPFIQGKIIGIFSKAFDINCWADEESISYKKDDIFVEFKVYASDKTIKSEIETERLNRMQEKERLLYHEVAEKTKALEKEKLRAETANLTKSKFLGAMSHEFLTPLNAIIGLGSLLQMEDDETSREEYLQNILHAGNDMLTLVKQILSYSETMVSGKKIDLQAVDTLEIIKDVISKNVPVTLPKKISVINKAENTQIPKLIGDYEYLKEILLVFLSNASKYIPEYGQIEISTKIINVSWINIEVSDNGSGIEEKYIPTLFKAFDRQSNQDGNISGAGVGLAIAKMMAEQIGGKIGYETNQHGGANFWVRLPVEQ